MDPFITATHYDKIAQQWRDNTPKDYGLWQLARAVKFTLMRGPALDVGCGSEGRFLEVLTSEGFAAEGMDISPQMLELARERHPEATFHLADICEWEPLREYDFISAWDSTFHLPTDQQEPVLRKLCQALAPGGVLLFTCGGGPAGEVAGTFWGQAFEYSTLGVEAYVRILAASGCFCMHVEYDQLPEQHVYIIGQKR